MPSLWVTGPEGALVAMEAEGYANEREFQELLADRPELLATAVDAGIDGGWLLVGRELPILSWEEAGSRRWSLDHLFIDSAGSPVLVEVKRSSDPRARREVVAQMLDYASVFALDWSAERLRARWEEQFRRSGRSKEEVLDPFLQAAGIDDEDTFWAQVQTRIDAGELRLLFVADRLSPTLVRIIEYLNRQLRTAEVLGVEVVRHAASAASVVAYEPVVLGRSSATLQHRKGPAKRRTRPEFEEILSAHHGDAVLAAVNELVRRADDRHGSFVSIGTSVNSPKLYLNFQAAGSGRTYWPLAIDPEPGRLMLLMRYLQGLHAFEDENVRADLLQRMTSAIGQELVGNQLRGQPWAPVALLAEPGTTDRVLEVLDWVIATVDASEMSGGS